MFKIQFKRGNKLTRGQKRVIQGVFEKTTKSLMGAYWDLLRIGEASIEIKKVEKENASLKDKLKKYQS
jgi:hypothetical protein